MAEQPSITSDAAMEAIAERVAHRSEARLLAAVKELLDERLGQHWLTRREAADQLGISEDTLDRKIADRDGIKVRRIGRAVRVLLPKVSR